MTIHTVEARSTSGFMVENEWMYVVSDLLGRSGFQPVQAPTSAGNDALHMNSQCLSTLHIERGCCKCR